MLLESKSNFEFMNFAGGFSGSYWLVMELQPQWLACCVGRCQVHFEINLRTFYTVLIIWLLAGVWALPTQKKLRAAEMIQFAQCVWYQAN